MSNYYIPEMKDSYNPCAGLGGIYNNRSFSEIFPEVEVFAEEYENSGLAIEASRISEDYIPVLYYLLMSRFSNSHPKTSDENRFKQNLFGTILTYGPTWETKVKVQKEFRSLFETDEILNGSIQVNNHSFNPSTPPAVDAFTPLSTINDQSANKRIKPKVEAYAGLVAVLKDNITEAFLDKFDKLFTNFLTPDSNLYYISKE